MPSHKAYRANIMIWMAKQKKSRPHINQNDGYGTTRATDGRDRGYVISDEETDHEH